MQGSYHVRLELLQKLKSAPPESLICLDGWLIFANVTSDYTPCHDVKSTEQASNDIENLVTNLFPQFNVPRAYGED